MNTSEITTRTEARDSLIEWAENMLSDAVNDPKCIQYPVGSVDRLVADALELCLGTEEDPKAIALYKEASVTAILRRKLIDSIDLAASSPALFK
jgi:hypothetical protein